MAEYTYEEVIINPTSEEAKNCLGKEVYYANNPLNCIKKANNNLGSKILRKIDKEKPSPFLINSPNNSSSFAGFSCIILNKTDTKSKYAPFESEDEFVYAYENSLKTAEPDSTEYRLYKNGGVWIRYIGETIGETSSSYQHVTEIWHNDLIIGCDTEILSWEDLKEKYTFLDGTPCGKLRENNNSCKYTYQDIIITPTSEMVN